MFLERTFQKLLINFTWWVNRKDITGKNIFGGGFLGLDNIGVFDRSKPLPTGGVLDQADGTAWMAFYCSTMLSMALELAREDPVYEDIASKFFEHFVAIVDAMNTLGGTGLWDEQDGFYYDQLFLDNRAIPLRVRSMVGTIPLFAVEVLESDVIDHLQGFPQADGLVSEQPQGPRPPHLLHEAVRQRQVPLSARHPLPTAARARAEISARSNPNFFPHMACARSRSFTAIIPTSSMPTASQYVVNYCPGEGDTGSVRRQQQLARARLVPL